MGSRGSAAAHPGARALGAGGAAERSAPAAALRSWAQGMAAAGPGQRSPSRRHGRLRVGPRCALPPGRAGEALPSARQPPGEKGPGSPRTPS